MKRFKPHDLAGRRIVNRIGYQAVWYPDHPSNPKAGYVYLHRLIMENHLGRYLKDGEVVHHKNEKRADNRLKNLKLITGREHARLHFDKSNIREVRKCAGCGLSFVTNNVTHLYCKPSCNLKRKSKTSRRRHKEVRYSRCAQCGDLFVKHVSKTIYCSPACGHAASERIKWPTKKKLLKLVWRYPKSILAKRLGVSDTAIRKHCDKLGLKYPGRGYWAHVKAKK